MSTGNQSGAGTIEYYFAIDPNQADAYYEIANLDYRQNKLQESEFAIRKAIQLDPENIWYWKLNAELYKRKGDMSGLVLVLDHLIKMEPELDAYYFDRCNALAIAGDIPAAMKGYDELEKKFGIPAFVENDATAMRSAGDSF